VTPAEQVLEHALGRPPTLGAGRLICLDGPSGSGKSSIARAIGAPTIHTDDLCPGWDGIPALPAILAGLLSPLTTGATGRQPRYDWILGHPVEDVVAQPVPVLILEGVGAGSRSIADLTTTLVWVDGDPVVRRERALERDGDYFREHWDSWAEAEAVFFAAEAVQARADLSFWTS
jgi:uridine kinase